MLDKARSGLQAGVVRSSGGEAVKPEPEVLLIEDDEVDVMAVRRALRKQRIENPLHVASDGLAGLELVSERSRSGAPLILLLDLNLPRMNGLEVLREIRSRPKVADTVVFVITTSKAQSDLSSAMALDVAGYIVKSEIEQDFAQVATMIRHYWQIVSQPNG